jgi:hypothetical protein
VPSFRTGTVTSILSERPGLQRVEVEGERAYVLTQLIGPVEVGDRVVMNTTAVELGLGTGGWHVVHWNLARDEWSEPGAGHEMKLRYTSLQVDAGGHASGRDRGKFPTPLPVVACFLHSQVACVAQAFKQLQPDKRLAYVMTDGGALPLAVSDLAAELRSEGLLDTIVTAGQAFGGEREAVNVYDALQSCTDHDAVVVGMGPGSLGTGTEYGYSGIEVVWAVRAVYDLARAGFEPIVAVRFSAADERERHAGLSHHTSTALSLARDVSVSVPIPRGEPLPDVGERHRVVEVDVPDVSEWPYTSMGRTAREDPQFFRYAAAAGVYAAQRLLD